MTFFQREFLIERLQHARKPLEDLLPKAPPEKEIYANWTVKELLAHLTGWDDVTIEALQAHGRGEPVSTTVSSAVSPSIEDGHLSPLENKDNKQTGILA